MGGGGGKEERGPFVHKGVHCEVSCKQVPILRKLLNAQRSTKGEGVEPRG